MATLHGAPLPEDFEDGKELTAAAFNAVKDYWVTDELPEEGPNGEKIVDGDVVFVIGDSPVGGGAPGAAVIGGATPDGNWPDPNDPDYPIRFSSFTGNGTNGDDGQAYDVYEFLGSGELVVSEAGMLDLLILSGGGGGASGNGQKSNHGGGGGAGGCLLVMDAFVSEGSPNVTVGAGGIGGNISNFPGTAGLSSYLQNYYSVGGAGGAAYNAAGMSGGCGSGAGGGISSPVGYMTGGLSIGSLGNDGGNGGRKSNDSAGGGGGGLGTAGANVVDPSYTTGGNGGDGLDYSAFIGANPGTLWLGGGGGGNGAAVAGAGGEGGSEQLGGSASVNGSGQNAKESTGSGGGASLDGTTEGKGSGGIVIVRVKVPTKSFGDRTRSVAPKTAHAARVENGVVRQVIVIPHLDDDDAKITQYCNSIGLEGTWVDTSYTGSRRGKYAGVGDLFDLKTRNAEFISPVIEEEDNG